MLLKMLEFIKRGFIINFSYRVYVILGILGLLVGVLRFGFMAKFVQEGNTFPALAPYGGDLMAYLVTGTAYMSYVGISLNSFRNAIRSEQMMGTLEYLLMSDTPLWQILLFSGISDFIWTTLNVGAVFVFLALIFGIKLNVNIALAIFILMLSMVCIGGIGLISAGIIMVTKKGDPVSWVFTTLSGLVSGVLFPVEILPTWMRWISYFLPVTYALSALRKALLIEASFQDVTGEVLMLVVMSAVTVPTGFYVFRLGFDKAREKGSLVEY